MGTVGLGDRGAWGQQGMGLHPDGCWLLPSASAGDLVLGSAGLMSRSSEMQDGDVLQR